MLPNNGAILYLYIYVSVVQLDIGHRVLLMPYANPKMGTILYLYTYVQSNFNGSNDLWDHGNLFETWVVRATEG